MSYLTEKCQILDIYFKNCDTKLIHFYKLQNNYMHILKTNMLKDVYSQTLMCQINVLRYMMEEYIHLTKWSCAACSHKEITVFGNCLKKMRTK